MKEDNAQTLDYCGVESHHPNGIVKRTIKKLTLNFRTMLIHAMRLWLEAIGKIIWAYTLKASTERLNSVDIRPYGKAMEEYFIVTTGLIFPNDLHTWGSPVYFLAAALQGYLSAIPKLYPRAQVEVYLGN